MRIPDDLGGWHMLKLVQDQAVDDADALLRRAQPGVVSPTQLKSGETVTIHAKGLGWTELDNGFAVTYDNAFVGYACGFNSNGDVRCRWSPRVAGYPPHRPVPDGLQRPGSQAVVLGAGTDVRQRLPGARVGLSAARLSPGGQRWQISAIFGDVR